MLKIRVSSQFKRDLKRYKHKPAALKELDVVLGVLTKQEKLHEKYRDHTLSGNWDSVRECHVKPDVLLIYQINESEKLLSLVRLGSHSDLFR